MRWQILCTAFCCFFYLSFQASAQAASSATAVDASFQSVHFEPGPYQYTGITDMLLREDGKILIRGLFNGVNGHGSTNLALLNSDGSVDTGFSATNSYPGSIALQRDGKILIAGGLGIKRLNADSSLDLSFNVPPECADWGSSLPQLLIGPAGEIYLAGSRIRTSYDDRNRFLARLGNDGAIDTMFRTHSWGGLGMTEEGIVRVAAQRDGKVVVAGYFSTDSGRRSLARFNWDGTEDTSFSADAVPMDTYPKDLLVQPDGKIMYSWFSGGDTAHLTRFTSNGALDKTFSFPPSDSVASLSVLADRRLIGIGTGLSSYMGRLLRFNRDGSLDRDFTFDNFDAHGLAVQPDGRILIFGSPIPGSVGTIWTNILRLRGDPVVFTSGSQVGSEVVFEWQLLDRTLSYRLESSDDLNTWSPVRMVAGTDNIIQHREPMGDAQFFRVIAE
jgi:uncharacterized delta-60 repeat protein